MQQSLISVGAIQALTAQSAFGLPSTHPRRRLGLGKWKNGPPTQIDCSHASFDFEYYIEKCFDALTMWWINGHCIDGEKQEVSELHRCHMPEGGRPYCHDCHYGNGNVKNVCGSDSSDHEEVCGIAWAGTAEDCGDQALTAYTHQCLEPSGGSESWYLRESYECAYEYVDYMGPCGENPEESTFTCGSEWYYPYLSDDPNVANFPGLVGMEHAFSSSGNKFCLDCGLAIAVCASSEEATCESLGLPKRGDNFTTTAAPYVEPPSLFTSPPALLSALTPPATPAPSSAPNPALTPTLASTPTLAPTTALTDAKEADESSETNKSDTLTMETTTAKEVTSTTIDASEAATKATEATTKATQATTKATAKAAANVNADATEGAYESTETTTTEDQPEEGMKATATEPSLVEEDWEVSATGKAAPFLVALCSKSLFVVGEIAGLVSTAFSL